MNTEVNYNLIPADEYEEVLDFYKQKHNIVNIVHCQKCERDIALEVDDKTQKRAAEKSHHQGLTVYPIGKYLLGYRKRLDGVMGYECLCGNDTRLCEPERGVIGSGLRGIMPHEEARVHTNIRAQKWQPNVVSNNSHTVVETFTIKHEKRGK